MPTVSIICTNFNKGEWIREAVESFLAQQTSFQYEIIIVDDASTDNSPEIIKEYAEKHPEQIKAVFNEKNLGITKTWIKACKKAKGKYIARCDGDDYWTNPHKLQKQVEALDANNDSAWSSCDFDVITPDGTVAEKTAFERGIFVRAYSYAHMLTTKGFTMASTWLVETKLMREINDVIDKDAIDDTFNIQLELFHRTKLTYIPESMVTYRVGYESDSHQVDAQKTKTRLNKLLKTQLEYINKYPEADMVEALKISMQAINVLESQLIDASNEMKNARSTINEQNSRIEEIMQSKRYRIGSKIAHVYDVLRKVVGGNKK